jgi:hypothetical protein
MAGVCKQPATTTRRWRSNATAFPTGGREFVERSTTPLCQTWVPTGNYLAWQMHKSIRTNECRGIRNRRDRDLSADSLRHNKKRFDVTDLEQNAPGIRRIIRCWLRIRLAVERPPPVARTRKSGSRVPKAGTVEKDSALSTTPLPEFRHGRTGDGLVPIKDTSTTQGATFGKHPYLRRVGSRLGSPRFARAFRQIWERSPTRRTQQRLKLRNSTFC